MVLDGSVFVMPVPKKAIDASNEEKDPCVARHAAAATKAPTA